MTVSYTHLDVYKRQSHGIVYSNEEVQAIAPHVVKSIAKIRRFDRNIRYIA